MTMTGVVVVLMIITMIVMCGAMVAGVVWASTRRRRAP